MNWSVRSHSQQRYQALFGDRMVRTFAERPASLDAMIRETAARHATRDAFVHGTRRLTYAELDRDLSSVAANLAARGVKPGDRVGVLCDSGIDFMLAVFGAIRLMAVAVPMGIRQQTPEIEFCINNCGISALVFDAALADRVPAAGRTPTLRHRFSAMGQSADAEPFESLLEPRPFAPAAIGEEDLAMVMYTSGTTGKPKGAMLPHIAFVHSAMHFELCLGHTEDTRSLLAIPPSHISGLGAIVVSMLRTGGCTVIQQTFKPTAFLELMAAERCTYAVLVPAMYKLCLIEPRLTEFDLSAWKLGLYGGAIMPPSTIEELMRRLPALELVNGYGATETTSPAAVMPIGHTAGQPDSVGITVPCGDILVIDDNGREVPAGDSGELWIGGPMIAKGYWDDPEATRSSFIAGYWRSGDIGSVDARGYVRVLDRKKDMINRGGFKVYSAEVENVLAQHPDIVESIVVASPDPVLGERVHAFICSRSARLTGEEVRAFCRPRMADYKLPELFDISAEPLPRNANGKFDKASLRGKVAAAGLISRDGTGRRTAGG